jgi:hypothetical protein
MRVPQLNDRVKEAPAQVLRAVFAGIGQLMSTADKIRNKPASAEAPAAPKPTAPKPAAPETVAPETVAPETVAPETVAPETVAPETVAHETAAPESVAPEPAAAEAAAMASVAREPVVPEIAPETAVPETAAPETVAPASVVPETVAPETVTPEVKPEAPVTSGGHVRLLPPDEVPAAAAAAGQLPVPNYDDLSVASLRARLRNLSADQISQLIDYEKGHAGRADVITMFERRIAKLAEG